MGQAAQSERISFTPDIMRNLETEGRWIEAAYT